MGATGRIERRETVQKVLAGAGLCSRRQAERWLREGRIQVNRETARPGDRIGQRDHLQIDGRPLPPHHPARTARTATEVLAYHKPVGEICTRRDEQGRPTVFRHLPRIEGRWINVGRLDLNSSGLLLFTNDGDLAHRLTHPRCGLEREYAVRVYGRVTPGKLERLLRSVPLEDGPARFLRLQAFGDSGKNQWFRVVLKEGRKREVRRLWESQGLRVNRLMRIRFGNCRLPEQSRTGSWRRIQHAERAQLLRLAGATSSHARR